MDVTHSSTYSIKTDGFTLIELIVTLGIGTLLLGLAIPTVSNIMHDTALSTQVNEFSAYLHYARSEAIKQHARVGVCKSPNGLKCDTSTAWHNGWIVFVDEDRDRQRSSDERLLQTGTIRSPNLTIDYGAFPTDNYVIYYPNGTSLGNGTFTFCNEKNKARALILYKTGRLRTSRTMPDGSPLSCP